MLAFMVLICFGYEFLLYISSQISVSANMEMCLFTTDVEAWMVADDDLIVS